VLVASHDLYLLEHFAVRRVRLEGGRIQTEADGGHSEPRLLDPSRLVAAGEGPQS
jgi:cell division transport system ATP-binding protein